MAKQTYYFVMYSDFYDGRPVLREPRQVSDERAARRLVARFAAEGHGALAFSRQLDFEAGEYEHADIICAEGITQEQVEHALLDAA